MSTTLPIGSDTQPHPPGLGESLSSLLSVWVTTHQLNACEQRRLEAVMQDYPSADQPDELRAELACILAARKLATLKPLTAEQIDRAREAIESGRTAFAPQDVD